MAGKTRDFFGLHQAKLVLKARLRRPPWGRIFLVFRSKNGPQAVLR